MEVICYDSAISIEKNIRAVWCSTPHYTRLHQYTSIENWPLKSSP